MTFYACRWRFPILRRRAFLAQKILMIISGYFTVFGYIFGHKLHLFYRHFVHKDQYQFLSKDNIDRRKRVTFILKYFHEKGSIPGKSRDCSLLEGDVVVIHFLFGDTCDNFLGFGRKRNVK